MLTQDPVFAVLGTHGFETIGALCCGTWRGYAVAVQRYGGKTYLAHMATRLDKFPAALRKAVKLKAKESCRCCKNVSAAGKQSLIGTFTVSGADDLYERFTQCMDAFTGALRENGIPPADTCAISGAPNPDSLCPIYHGYSGSYQPVCASAVRSRNLETQERLETNENSGSYLLGILGAVLGMLVGLIPNVLTILFTETIYAMLFALVPLAAMFGYKLFRGKMNTVSVVVVIVVSLLGVVLIPYIEFVYYILQSYSLSLGDAMYAALQLMLDPEVLSDLTGELLQLLLFMALGLFVAWRFLRGNVNSNVAAASRAQLDSLRPNPAFAARPEEPAQDEE